MSDTVQIFNAVIGMVTALGMAWIGYLTLRVKAQQEQAVVKVAQAAVKVEQKVEAVAVKQDEAAALAAEAVAHAATVAVRQKEVAARVGVVVEKLKESTSSASAKLDGIKKLGEANHLLLNSSHGAALNTVAQLARWKAERTGDQADVMAADHAEKMAADHERKQAVVDARAERG